MKKFIKWWTTNRLIVLVVTPLILIFAIVIPHCDSATDKSAKCASDLIDSFSKIPEKVDAITIAASAFLLADSSQSEGKKETLDNSLIEYERYIKSVSNGISKCKCKKNYEKPLEQIRQEIEGIRSNLQSQEAPHLNAVIALSKDVAQDSHVGDNCCSMWNYFFYRQ